LTFCEDGDARRGMLWLVRALGHAEDAEDKPLQQFVRTNLAGWRRQLIPLGAFFSHQEEDQGSIGRVTEIGPNGDYRREPFAKARLLIVPRADGKTVAITSLRRKGKGVMGEVKLWNLGTGKPVGEPLLHEGEIVAVAFSPDSSTIGTGDGDGMARLW